MEFETNLTIIKCESDINKLSMESQPSVNKRKAANEVTPMFNKRRKKQHNVLLQEDGMQTESPVASNGYFL